MNTRTKILVTDGDNRATLAITRALGAKHQVTVAGIRRSSLASTSRYCHDSAIYPDPSVDESAFANALLAEVKQRGIELLITVSDITTFAVAQRLAEFERHCRVSLPDLEALQTAANKAAIMRLAQSVGVPIPRTYYVEPDAIGDAVKCDIPYPIVVKPARSRVRSNDGWVSTSVQYAANDTHLIDILKQLPPAAFPVLLQERIRGLGTGFFACYDRGHCVAVFAHRRLREKPPSGGVSVLCESVEMDAVLRGHAERLLDRLGWHGVAMVEFKNDERDGIPKLMEINGRFWGSLQLAIDAGVDFPSILLKIGKGKCTPRSPDYRVGVRSRWLWGDFDSLLARLFKRAERMKLPPAQQSRLRAVRDFVFNFFDPHTRLELPRINDLRPWLFETVQWFKRR